MPALVHRRFRIHNAKQFEEAISETAASNIYFFISRVSEWSATDTPATPVDNIQENDFDVWRTMIAMKKVGTADISFAVPRYNWETGKRYRMYDASDTTLYDAPAAANTFYVMNSNYNVYKCLFNNKNALSTVEPSGTPTSSIINTADGYRWKYMYTIESGARLKFLSNDWMPVKTISTDDGSAQYDVQTNASNGSIEVIKLTAAGSNYKSDMGTIAAAFANTTEYKLATSANTTSSIYTGSSIFLTGGTGSGQVREITGYTGDVRKIKIASAFSPAADATTTYVIGPKITITGDGNSATAYANVHNGVVNYINMVSTGDSYSNGTITITANSTHGSGATASAIISPQGGHGKDPINELGGHNVILNTLLTGSESDTFMDVNNFRIVGLVKDPIVKSTQVVASSSTYDLTTRLHINNAGNGNFNQDEIVTGGTSGAKGKIAQFININSHPTAANGIMRLIDTNGTFTVGETITSANTSLTATIVTGGVTTPPIESFKGDVIYRENRSPVTRSSDQIEDIKLVVKF